MLHRIVAALALGAVAVGPAAAEPAPAIGVELNRLETVEGECRAYLVLDNRGGALESLELDLVLFDPDGVIARRLAVEAGPLRAGRESVKVFTIGGLACDGIGRVLLNDVLSCTGEGAGDDCLGRIEASSRAAAPLSN
ncbi:MAG: hypothetical protein R6V44_07810 [Paracoccaceae bacterium]